MNVGDYVRYKNTGTIGKVISTSSESGVEWIEFDNKLVYRAEYLEKATENEYRAASVKERTQGMSLDEIERIKDELMKAERHSFATGGGGG